MDNVYAEKFDLAIRLHIENNYDQAKNIYVELLDMFPNDIVCLNNLAILSEGTIKEKLLLKALQIDPTYKDANINIANYYFDLEFYEKSLYYFNLLIEIDPSKIEFLLKIGDINFKLKKFNEAIKAYKSIDLLMPNNAEIFTRLGQTFALKSMLKIDTDNSNEEAVFYFEQALSIDSSLKLPNDFISQYLELKGQPTKALLYRKNISDKIDFKFIDAPNEIRKVLIIQAPGDGNIPFRNIIPNTHNSYILTTMFLNEIDTLDHFPKFNVAINCVGNPDFLSEKLINNIKKIQNKFTNRILNPIEKILQTRRDKIKFLLSDIDDVIVPETIILNKASLRNIIDNKDISNLSIEYPFIIRPVGGHGGYGMSLIENLEALSNYMINEAEAFYCINFHDYKSEDHYYRKYRSVFVDRKIYHYHLAISNNWIVHYFSADMLKEPFKRHEEHHFLDFPEKTIGTKAHKALELIAQRLDLDYAGIDYSILKDGRLFVFETNSLISVYPVDPDHFPYKASYANAIFDAVEVMLNKYSDLRCP